jgi:hypothetical protein
MFMTYLLFAIFFAKRAFIPIPGMLVPFAAFPRGACGTTIWAAWEGLCSGWMGAETGESVGVDVADMLIDNKG